MYYLLVYYGEAVDEFIDSKSGGEDGREDRRDSLMDSVFNDHVFPKYKDQQVMKPQMDGLDDPTLRYFTLLDLSALVKDELKGRQVRR